MYVFFFFFFFFFGGGGGGVEGLFLFSFLLWLPIGCCLILNVSLFLKGMNTEDFKYKWGGEDWDLLSRVLNATLEVERIKHPGLYHHYHTKQKAWN